MKERLPPWKRLMIGPDKDSDAFAWDGDPIDAVGRSLDRSDPPMPHDPVASRNGFTSLFSSLVERDVRTKPSYTDCWLTSLSKDVKVISRYSTQFARVTVGLAEDGQTEYAVVPVEYSFPDPANVIVSDVIGRIRSTYRTRGGRLDRDSVMGAARAALTDRYEDIKKACNDSSDLERLVDDMCSAAYRHSVGAGIFEVLLSDSHIEDVYLDAPCDENRIHVTMNGVDGVNAHMRCRTNLMVDSREMDNVVNILKRDSGLRLCESSPVLETDFREFDARATVIGYPMSPNGYALAIRKHSARPWTLTRLLANGTMDARSAGLLSFLVNNRSTFLVCGPRGAGKSSLLSALMLELPLSQRILTIEDTIELPGERMRSMGYKVQTILVDERNEENPLAGAKEALRVSLRMGESAIVMGEVRGEEARTLYQSMRTGKAGSTIMGTIHGDSAASVYNRVVHDMGIAPEAFMATDVIVTLGTLKDRRTGNLVRRMRELVSTSKEPGTFIDISNQDRMFDSPVMKRAMQTAQMGRRDVVKDIRARSAMRSHLVELGRTDERYLGPEWILASNDLLSRMPPTASAESILNEFKRRTAGSYGERFDRQQEAPQRMPDRRGDDDLVPGVWRVHRRRREDGRLGGAEPFEETVLGDSPQAGHEVSPEHQRVRGRRHVQPSGVGCRISPRRPHVRRRRGVVYL